MRGIRTASLVLGVWLCGAALSAPASAASCGGDYGAWLGTVQREAAGRGVSRATIASSLSGLTMDPRVLSLDRSQHVFKQSFEQFAGRMAAPPRVRRGVALMQQHRSLLARIEHTFGVPAPVTVAIWGLETDYGANIGRYPTIRSLATLAYDCRRTERFQGELFSALRIIDRGDLRPDEMRGAWAGELGQTQFLPSSYLRYAVDFDGNGHRDLLRSVPDVLASTANYLRGYGWQRGGSWGPGTHNFAVLGEWNKAEVYRKTIALFADRLAGAGRQAANQK